MNLKYFLHNFKEKNRLDLSPDIKRIFILTGSGISAESGIATFREKNGLWNNYNIYEVARPEAMSLTPEIFFKFQNERAKDYINKEPNMAHHSLKELESNFEILICTQNIDNLHEKAGSTIVKHIHGKINECICNYCLKKMHYENNIFGMNCPYCQKGKIRPDVVLFKEQPRYISEIFKFMTTCDLFIQIGTSGNVYPAANLIKEFKSLNKPSINISLEPPLNNVSFTYSFYGKASKWVPYITNILLKK